MKISFINSGPGYKHIHGLRLIQMLVLKRIVRLYHNLVNRDLDYMSKH